MVRDLEATCLCSFILDPRQFIQIHIFHSSTLYTFHVAMSLDDGIVSLRGTSLILIMGIAIIQPVLLMQRMTRGFTAFRENRCSVSSVLRAARAPPNLTG